MKFKQFSCLRCLKREPPLFDLISVSDWSSPNTCIDFVDLMFSVDTVPWDKKAQFSSRACLGSFDPICYTSNFTIQGFTRLKISYGLRPRSPPRRSPSYRGGRRRDSRARNDSRRRWKAWGSLVCWSHNHVFKNNSQHRPKKTVQLRIFWNILKNFKCVPRTELVESWQIFLKTWFLLMQCLFWKGKLMEFTL